MPTADTERSPAALEKRLWDEFHALNAAHFAGKLNLREIRVSTRKQYGGYYRPSDSLIVVSWQAFCEHGWEETCETFRHEVAHIVHPNHSRAFWELAARLGCTRKYASPPKDRTATCPFVYECPACLARVHRRKRLIKSSCGKCDKRFNPRFQLRLVSSPASRREGKAC